MANNDNIAFYNPKDLGGFDLGTTQINKLLRFRTLNGVFTPLARVDLYNGARLVRSYPFAEMELTGDNVQGSEKTLILTLQGADYLEYGRRTLTGKCFSFFVEGDLEMIFQLAIK